MRKGVALTWVLRLLPAWLVTACVTATAPPSRPPAAPVQEAPTAAPAPVADNDQAMEVPVSLTAEHISPVFAAARPRVKGLCWQPALDARAADAPLVARVVVDVEIEPSGKVAAVHTDGEPSRYPQLADCIATVVRSLTFRRALTPTRVNIPYVFEADASTPHD